MAQIGTAYGVGEEGVSGEDDAVGFAIPANAAGSMAGWLSL